MRMLGNTTNCDVSPKIRRQAYFAEVVYLVIISGVIVAQLVLTPISEMTDLGSDMGIRVFGTSVMTSKTGPLGS